MFRLALFIILVCLVSLSALAKDREFRLIEERSSIGFVAHTKPSDVRGTFKSWKASGSMDGDAIGTAKATISVDVASLDTKNNARDKHLRKEDFFWVEKYPTAIFEFTRATQLDPKKLSVLGKMTIRGVTKDLNFEATINPTLKIGTTNYHVQGTVVLNRQDFGISYKPFFLLPAIRDDVDVVFDLWAQ